MAYVIALSQWKDNQLHIMKFFVLSAFTSDPCFPYIHQIPSITDIISSLSIKNFISPTSNIIVFNTIIFILIFLIHIVLIFVSCSYFNHFVNFLDNLINPKFTKPYNYNRNIGEKLSANNALKVKKYVTVSQFLYSNPVRRLDYWS